MAITRPKNRLFIYDEVVENRKPIERVWQEIGAVQRVTRDQVESMLAEKKLQEPSEADVQMISTLTAEVPAGTLGQQPCDQETWKLHGLKFLKQKNYEQAVKCFTYARSRQLTLVCKAHIAARAAQEKQVKNDQRAWEFKRKYSLLSKVKRRESVA